MSTSILLPREVGEGKEREVETLLADRWRKLVIIRLRRGALLADHSAKFPITVQALAGKGILRVSGAEYPLAAGVIVPVDAQIVHSVQGDPDLAILVTFFRRPGAEDVNDTTARFD
jgi:quercetin dioxygenase-like cupin family protein